MAVIVPQNITANVGVASGAPNSPETTAQYLTQLQQSLNGFTGSTAQALNYLLSFAAAAPPTRHLGISLFTNKTGGGMSVPVPNTGTSSYTTGGMAFRNASGGFVSGSSGSLGSMPVFTPAATGRVAIFSWFTWDPSFTSPGENGSVNTILEYGVGDQTVAPVQGVAAPVGTQIGLGSIASATAGDTNAFGSSFFMAPMALLSGLSKTTTYWVDVGFSVSISTVGTGGTIQPNGALVILEC